MNPIYSTASQLHGSVHHLLLACTYDVSEIETISFYSSVQKQHKENNIVGHITDQIAEVH